MEKAANNYARFPFENLNGITFINLYEVVYCKSDGNYVYFIFMNGKKMTSSYPLKVWEQRLPASLFSRISNSVIVNKDHVIGYYKGKGGTVVFDNGESADVSRQRKNDFLLSMGYSR